MDPKDICPKKHPEEAKRLLAENPQLLATLDRQRQFILRVYSAPCPCPMCFRPVNVFEAADDTRDLSGSYNGHYVCPHCATELRHVVPLIGAAWLWVRAHPIDVDEEAQ